MRGEVCQILILYGSFVVAILKHDNHDAIEVTGARFRRGFGSLFFFLLGRLRGLGGAEQ
jgi:hypothetical protein